MIFSKIKHFLIAIFVIAPFKSRTKIMVSMFRKNNRTGPGRFIFNLDSSIRAPYKIVYSPLGLPKKILVISNFPAWLYELCTLFRVKTILRVDGFSFPDYYDNTEYVNRARRDLSLYRMRISQELQTGLLLADHVIYQSRFSKEMADKFLYKRVDGYSIIYNGTDIEYIKPAQDKSSEVIKLLYYGNIRDSDICECVLQIFQRVAITRKPIELHIAGTVTPSVSAVIDKYLEAFKSLGLENQVILHGHVAYKDMPDFLSQMDLLVHLTAGDACPNSVIEAMSAGLAVLCQSYGGQSELVGDAGLIIGTIDYDYSDRVVIEAVEIVTGLLANVDNLRAIQKRARARATKEFDLNSMARKYNEVFAHLESD